MARRSRLKLKGRAENGRFLALPSACLNHDNFKSLSAKAVKLLIDIYSQYYGYNNGDLCCTWTIMEKRGWKSRDTLNRARRELIHYGWISLTRQGGLNRPSLYCVTFQAIDDCAGKLDVKSTITAPGDWKADKTIFNYYKSKTSNFNVQLAHRTTAVQL